MKRSGIGLRHAALAVQNLDRALKFYCDHLDAKPYHVQDKDWAMVLVGTTSVSLVPHFPNASSSTPVKEKASHPAHVGFVVATPDEVHSWHRRLLGVPGIQVAKVEEHRDGSVGFYFSDTENNRLELIAIPLHSKAHKPLKSVWLVLPDTLDLREAWIQSLLAAFGFHTHGSKLHLVRAAEFERGLEMRDPFQIIAWSQAEEDFVRSLGMGTHLKGSLLGDSEILEAFAARLSL